MAIDTWIDGSNNNIYAASAWMNGTPKPGDMPVFGAGIAFMGSGNLNAATLVLSGISATSQPTLIACGQSQISVLLSQEEYLHPGIGNAAWGTVDVEGAPQVLMKVLGGKGTNEVGTVNIDSSSQMRGAFIETGDNASVVINGTSTSTFANTSSAIGSNDAAQINAAVVGVGTFQVSFLSSLHLNAGVSSGQTIEDQGYVSIADTRDFYGRIDWSPQPAGNNVINLANLTADSSTYQNGVLSLFAGGHDVFDLRLHLTGGSSLTTTQTSGGVQVYASMAQANATHTLLLTHV
jgi:hypothetical protein